MDDITSAIEALNLTDKNASMQAESEECKDNTNTAFNAAVKQSILDELTNQVQKQLNDFFDSIRGKLNESVAKSCAELHFLSCPDADKGKKQNVEENDKTDKNEKQNDDDKLVTEVVEIDDTATETNLEITSLKGQIEILDEQCREIQKGLDERVALSIQESEQNNNRFEKIENNLTDLKEKHDSTEQQGRKETVEFHNIPPIPESWGQENTDNVIIHFCEKHLKLRITTKDISVSHRQIHPEQQQKQGDSYIPPIYCKFVSRRLAKACMDRRHLIKDLRNNRNQNIFMMENLTFSRRILWERVKDESSFQYKWIKNGKIFVRKFENSRSLLILTEKHLNNARNEPIGDTDYRHHYRKPFNRDRNRTSHVTQPPPFPFRNREVHLSEYFPRNFFSTPCSYKDSLLRNVYYR